MTATRAIDRVLRAGHYWVPHWYKAAHNLAFWDKFGRPRSSRATSAASCIPGGTTPKKLPSLKPN